MKRKILICAHYLEIGGAEISLIGLLRTINYTKYDVSLFLYRKRGELLSLVPEEVHILEEIPEYAQMESPISDTIRRGHFRQAFARLKAKYKYRRWARINNPQTPEAYFQYLDNEITPTLPSLYHLGEFDAAINFIGLRNHIPAKVNAKRTLTWIHTDLCSTPVNVNLEFPSWNIYDTIVSVSEVVTESFIKLFPALKPKVVEIENILSPSFVRQRSEEEDVKDLIQSYGGKVNILSIGRFCHAKNYDNVPDICKRILEKGINVRWFIIGYGGDEELIKERINETGMVKHVILLGKKDNPYPYIKACDVYIQPSRYEGKSVTVREAQILGKPVIVTAYKTASSQVRQNKDGVIVPIENGPCADAIAEIISDQSRLRALSEFCYEHDFGNEAEVRKLYDVIEL